MTASINRQDETTMILFTGSKGQVITTPLSSLTLVRGKGDFKAFFGNGGTAVITEQEYNDLHSLLGLAVPKATADGDGDGLTTPA